MTHPTPNDAMKDIERLIDALVGATADDDIEVFNRARAALLAAIGKLVASTQPATDMGKRTGSTAPASSHGIPDAGESANKADPSGPQGARNAVANGGDARTETSGRAHPSTQPAMSQDAQPVAWKVVPRYEDEQGYFDFTDSAEAATKLSARGWKVTPLYSNPPIPQEVREALEDAMRWLAAFAYGQKALSEVQASPRWGKYTQALAILRSTNNEEMK
jgi:hypothetical protein